MLKFKNLLIILLLMIHVSCNKIVSDENIVSCNKIISDENIHIYKVTPDSLFGSIENSRLYKESQELGMKGKYKEALEILLKIEKKEPKNKLVLSDIGGKYSLLKEYDFSENYHKKVIEIDSTFFINWVNLSTLYISKKEFELAYETLMKTSDLEKTEEENIFFMLQLAIIKYHLGNCNEALFLCEDVINLIEDKYLLANVKNTYETIKRNCIEK